MWQISYITLLGEELPFFLKKKKQHWACILFLSFIGITPMHIYWLFEKSHFGECFLGCEVSGDIIVSFTLKVGFDIVVGVLHPFVI